MKRMYTEKTDSFTAYDTENKEYLVHEFTHYNDVQSAEKLVEKVAIVQSYKTETGEHVQKKDDANFTILTGYGVKNIEVHKRKKK